jgi:hypothetical protein
MNYNEWNVLLCDHFIRNAAVDTPVYLTVDEELLRSLAAAQGVDGTDGAAVRDFTTSVRIQVRSGRVDGDDMALTSLEGNDASGRPKGVAFLALCVLAGHKMGDGAFNDTAYFSQLCELLGFNGNPRPTGLPAGAEEPLWRHWARFLAQNNLLSTAKEGPIGPTRYLNFPVSQTLLRFADRERLLKEFAERSFFQSQRDPDILVARLYALRHGLTVRLQEKLKWTGDRFQGFSMAVADLHAAYLQTRQPRAGAVGNAAVIVGESTLVAELVRVHGGFLHPPQYQIYLRTRPGFAFGAGVGSGPEIVMGAECIPIEPSESGWATTQYIGNLSPDEIRSGATFPIQNGGIYKEAVLTQRPFRILIADPDALGSGTYSAGHVTATGVPFVFLCQDRYVSDLDRLRSLGKINWQKRSQFGGTGWTEFEGMMILDEDWTHVRAGDPDLYNALRPKSKRTIGIAGGLKTPMGYLAGVAPQITIFGAGNQIPVQLIRIQDVGDIPLWSGSTQHAKPVPIPECLLDRPGIYRIEAGEGDAKTERLLRISDWDNLTLAPVTSGIFSSDPLSRNKWE